MSEYLGNNPNGLTIVLSDDYSTEGSGIAASTKCVNDAVEAILAAMGILQVPVGMMLPYMSNTVLSIDGYLFCDGSAVSRTEYSRLFAVIGTTYGAGDGSTTFNLPNTINRVMWGGNVAGQYIEAGLPNITGSLLTSFRSTSRATSDVGDGALLASRVGAAGESGGDNQSIWNIDLNASRSNPIYGNSDTVQPPSLTTRWYIKY